MLAVYHHDPYTSYEYTPAMSMYTMPPQPQYAYAAAPPPPPPQRQFGGHGTSSAFSSSANPDEDWTKISDLAERRRIQNRIAQRNYRKKLKRRMEDLERRAGEEGGSEPEKNTTSAKSPKKTSPTAKPKSAPSKTPAKQDQYPPAMVQDDELLFPPAVYDDARARSHTPPVFPYGAYQPSEELIFAPPYSSSPHAVPMTTEAYPTYFLAPVPVTLPPMNHFNDAVTKREYPAHDDSMGYMHYGYVPGVEMTPPGSYDASGPHTPPLSHSFDHSANCSEASYEYPTTPLSMPGSPSMIQQ